MKILRRTVVKLDDGSWFCPGYHVTFDTDEEAREFVDTAETHTTDLISDYIDQLRAAFWFRA